MPDLPWEDVHNGLRFEIAELQFYRLGASVYLAIGEVSWCVKG